MNILCLDSSGYFLRSGIYSENSKLAEAVSDSQGNHSERIIYQVDNMLRDAGLQLDDLEGLAINLGPGSFTGLRIGLAAMAGISASQKLPLAGFPAFEIIARDLAGRDGDYLALIPCRGNEFYSARYKVSGNKVALTGGYRVISPERQESPKESVILIGTGAERFYELSTDNDRKKLKLQENADRFPGLKSLAALAVDRIKQDYSFDDGIPNLFYIAPSQAEVNYARKKGIHR